MNVSPQTCSVLRGGRGAVSHYIPLCAAFLLVNQAPPSPKYTYEEDSDGFEVINFA